MLLILNKIKINKLMSIKTGQGLFTLGYKTLNLVCIGRNIDRFLQATIMFTIIFKVSKLNAFIHNKLRN